LNGHQEFHELLLSCFSEQSFVYYRKYQNVSRRRAWIQIIKLILLYFLLCPLVTLTFSLPVTLNRMFSFLQLTLCRARLTQKEQELANTRREYENLEQIRYKMAANLVNTFPRSETDNLMILGEYYTYCACSMRELLIVHFCCWS